MHRNRSVDIHRFSLTPSPDVPRSSFRIESAHKTTFDAGYLYPIYVEEMLPADTFNLSMTVFARLATPIYPIMDNLYLDSFFFFVPYRILWDNFVKMMGEQRNPADSISYVVPQVVCPASGYVVGTLQDYFGLPTVGQVTAAATVSHSTLPLRAYNLIFREWFRDENLQNSPVVDLDDGPDLYSDYVLLRRGKRHDYFTSSLPWPQKGGTAISIPLGTTAPVYGNGTTLGINQGATTFGLTIDATGYATGSAGVIGAAAGTAPSGGGTAASKSLGVLTAAQAAASGFGAAASGLYADLSAATAATINQLRQSFQIQKLLERDARGGTRYTEILWSHYRVRSEDARLQRPEYLGGGSSPVNISTVPQTSGSGASGTTAPLGTLAAFGTVLQAGHGFTYSASEHGVVIGLISVRADLSYQQGLRRMWSRSTRYDFYWPAFAMLGEQSILNKEIYCTGGVGDASVFGYTERWNEYRYMPSMITGLFRSTSAGTIDGWHLSQKFTSLPTLNTTFIQDTPPLSRVLAVGAGANGQQLIGDFFFRNIAARPLPMFSVPGLIDHF